MIRIDPRELAAIGLTNTKAKTIVTIAQLALKKELIFSNQYPLQSIVGIGPWTHVCIRLEVLHNLNAFLDTDLGVVKSLENLCGAQKISKEAMTKWIKAASPYGSYATLLWWKHLETVEPKKKK